MPARTARERSAAANSSHQNGHKISSSASTTSLRSLLSSTDALVQQQQQSPPPPLPQPQWSDVSSHDQSLPALKPVPPQDGVRRGSLNPPQLVINTSTVQRPGLQLRTTSAPMIATNRPTTRNGPHSARMTTRVIEEHQVLDTPDSSDSNVHSALTEEEERSAADMSSAMNSFRLLERLEVQDAPAQINIAVLSGDGVNKSNFVARALGLPSLPTNRPAERRITHQRRPYLVRLLEIAYGDVDHVDHMGDAVEELTWTNQADRKAMPRIDGALALYDVRTRASVEQVKEMLVVLSKEAIPLILVSSKCETPLAERAVDPAQVEDDLTRSINGIHTMRISDANPDSYRRTVHTILECIVENLSDRTRSTSQTRRRALSGALRATSPRPPGVPNHSRASSEFTGSQHKERRYAKQDSSNGDYSGSKLLGVPIAHPKEQVQTTFFESGSDDSPTSAQFPEDDEENFGESSSSLPEQGMTFDELIDRLLAQPSSKTDVKFVAIFLALYRHFAPPSRVLDAIIKRFDALEEGNSPSMLKTVHQSRYIAVLEQWASNYPGDFAFPRTLRHLRTFVHRLSEMSIFSAAAKMLSHAMEAVHEDDDTHWAYCDRDREDYADTRRNSSSSTASTLIDDPSFFTTELDYSATMKEVTAPDTLPPPANHILSSVEAAQRQSALLQPIPRYPITKVHWHALMEIPVDIIAEEITRIDWVMFSANRPRDLLRHISLPSHQKADCSRNLLHINRKIDHFNHLAVWVANFILLRDKAKHRARMMTKFIQLARRLREMNNYSSLGAILAALKSSPIHRLQSSRDLVDPIDGRVWLKLDILMAPSRSYAAYRLAWQNSTSERIPYLPIHRRDLITAEQGNRTFLDDEPSSLPSQPSSSTADPESASASFMSSSAASFATAATTLTTATASAQAARRINWKKFEIMGETIVGLQAAHDAQYRSLGGFKGNDQVRELILDVKLLRDEEDLHDRSVQCEPPASATADRSATSSTSTSGKFREYFKARIFDSSR